MSVCLEFYASDSTQSKLLFCWILGQKKPFILTAKFSLADLLARATSFLMGQLNLQVPHKSLRLFFDTTKLSINSFPNLHLLLLYLLLFSPKSTKLSTTSLHRGGTAAVSYYRCRDRFAEG